MERCEEYSRNNNVVYIYWLLHTWQEPCCTLYSHVQIVFFNMRICTFSLMMVHYAYNTFVYLTMYWARVNTFSFNAFICKWTHSETLNNPVSSTKKKKRVTVKKQYNGKVIQCRNVRNSNLMLSIAKFLSPWMTVSLSQTLASDRGVTTSTVKWAFLLSVVKRA